jgi:hypothetical protein
MDKQLTPTARLTHDALQNGPGNVHELCERTGRSRSATDKALGELAKAELIVKVDDGGDPADGAPARWRLAIDPAPVDGEATAAPQMAGDGSAAQPAADQPDTADLDGPMPDAEVTASPPPGDTDTPAADAQPTDPTPPPVADASAGSDPTEQTAGSGSDADNGTTPATGDGQPDGQTKPDGDAQQADEPKLCRGCQAQMPKICADCWQKTGAYCGNCRKNMPQVRRGEPGEPQILSNGLLKLRPGELEKLILKVMREQPLPNHVGITGWTGARVAIFLPGRSPSAINNALDKFSRTGECELIGDKPMRYRLKDTAQPDTDNPDNNHNNNADAASDNAQAKASRADARQPAPDSDAEAAAPKADTTA